MIKTILLAVLASLVISAQPALAQPAKPVEKGAKTQQVEPNIAEFDKHLAQMQENMKRMQEQLASVEVEGEAGAGMVKVVMTCRHDVKRVSIDPSLLADDKDMLEDLVAAAVNDAVRKVESTVQEKMAGMTAGLPLPPGMKLPF